MYSCETAIISLIDHWKVNMDKKMHNLAIFVDFKKAFDLINPKLLFLKLFQYGFDNKSLSFFRDYFENRIQVCRVETVTSSKLK